jgi:nitrite reductase/ring-hydroxylating ferredoxin subunit
MGNLAEDVVTCPFRGARFDTTTGKKMKDPVLTPSQQKWNHYQKMAKVLGTFRPIDVSY